jgi:outer membrane protein, heavy metal efflux system
MKHALFAFLAALALHANAADYSDLPPPEEIKAALGTNAGVQMAETGVLLEQANRRKWEAGSHEFNVRVGSARRSVTGVQGSLKEWDVALERPLRLPNKVSIDSDIGAQGVARAEFALGDARHEASRALLHLWFNWKREQAQAGQWQQQVDILGQQAQMTEKRMQAGDAPRMELNQAQAALAQASVALQQARARTQLAATDILRLFPDFALPQQTTSAEPQAISRDAAYWKDLVLEHNHELDMAQADARYQRLLAERSRADRIADPTVGVRYSNEMGGNERVAGVYLSVPFSFGARGATAEAAGYQAQISAQREIAVRRRLENDIASTYAQAVSSYDTWQQAHEAASSIRQNADLVARAYALGESSLSEVLTARRLALESSLADTVARLDANEARYRLLLDAHQLWSQEGTEASR